MQLSALLKLAGWLVSIPAFAAWLESLVKNSVTTWDRLPEWLKALLLTAGVAAGTSLIHDLVSGATGGSSTATVPDGYHKAWVANGVQFYYNPNTGGYGVMGKKRFKKYRIRKPVGVVYSDGVSNLKALAKTTKAIRKQVRGIEQALTIVDGGRKRLPAPEKKYTPAEMKQIRNAVE